jgi:hypothetical protein
MSVMYRETKGTTVGGESQKRRSGSETKNLYKEARSILPVSIVHVIAGDAKKRLALDLV